MAHSPTVSDPTDVRALDRAVHDRSAFRCGKEPLDRWLREFAGNAVRRGTARTYVLCDEGGTVVIGYYTLSAFSLDSAKAPTVLTKGSRIPVPCVLLGQLAVDERHHGQGVGSELLVSAMYLATVAAAAIGVRAFVVHAMDVDAAGYYQAKGFRLLAEGEMTFFLPMTDVRATLGKAGVVEL